VTLVLRSILAWRLEGTLETTRRTTKRHVPEDSDSFETLKVMKPCCISVHRRCTLEN
jgi:hypothetical protein